MALDKIIKMKTIFITGSTDGIGKMTALKLAKEGHEILVHGRNPEKLDATIKEAKQVSGNENVNGFLADFSNLKSVAHMAHQIVKQYPKIDVLINNAGIFKTAIEQNQEGLDVRFVVNFLSPVLLTDLLKPLLEKGESPRIVNLSSAAQATVSMAALMGDENIGMQQAYAQSKLALTMWSFDFAKKNPKIVSIAVNPGSLLNTKMALKTYGQHWSPTEKGVDILYELALSDKHAEHSGAYFDNDKGAYADAHPDAYDPQLIDSVLEGSRIFYHL